MGFATTFATKTKPRVDDEMGVNTKQKSKEDKAFVAKLKKQKPAGLAKISFGKIFLVTLVLGPLMWLEHYLVGKGTFVTSIFLTVYICSHVFEVKAHNATSLMLHRAKIERALISNVTPVESTAWLAAFLNSFWEELIEEKVASNVYKVISDKISEKKPAFVSKMEIESLDFGSTPPNVNNFQVHGTDDPDLKVMEFDVDFNGEDFRLIIKAVGSDEYMLLRGRHFSIKITALGFKFRARLYIHKKANMMFVTAVTRPQFYLFDSHMAGLSPKAIPFFNVRDFLESGFEKALVEPKRLAMLMEEKVLGPLPSEPRGGKFTLRVHACEDLPATSITSKTLPQVVVSTDLNTFKSKVLEGVDPEVGESYEIDILGGNSNVEILVIDVNNNNKRMGTARFDLSVSRGNCTTL